LHNEHGDSEDTKSAFQDFQSQTVCPYSPSGPGNHNRRSETFTQRSSAEQEYGAPATVRNWKCPTTQKERFYSLRILGSTTNGRQCRPQSESQGAPDATTPPSWPFELADGTLRARPAHMFICLSPGRKP
jgi:hypothetical protein